MSIEALALPLDRARTKLFTSALRVRVLRGLLLEKRRRIPALFVLHAGVALVGAILAPTALLVLGPLLLGVPHLISDLRYLVVRPRVTPSVRAVLLGGSALLLGARVTHELGLLSSEGFESWAASALLMGACLAVSRGSERWRVLTAFVATLGLAFASWAWPAQVRLTLAHGHNLVALGLWAWVFTRDRGRAIKLVLAFLGIAVLLVVSPFAWYGFKLGVRESFGLHSFTAADALAPGVHGAALSLGIVACFAFLQSLHYAVWLHAIPQEQTRGDATLSFRMSLRQLSRELGRAGLAFGALLIIALPLVAMAGSPGSAKDLYLSLSGFHAYLELAAGLIFFVTRARPSVHEANPCS